MLADISGESLTRHPSDAGAHTLDTDHEGESEECRPQHAITETGADLGIGGNATRVIVRRPSDKAWPQLFPERRLFRKSSIIFVHSFPFY